MRFQWSVNTVENAGTQATKHNDYKRPRLRCIVACFQCSCIELQLHSISMPHPRRACFEPELCTLWNVMTDLKWKKCIEQHTELRIESSQLWYKGKFFASVAENLRAINNIAECARACTSIEYFMNWIKKRYDCIWVENMCFCHNH